MRAVTRLEPKDGTDPDTQHQYQSQTNNSKINILLEQILAF